VIYTLLSNINWQSLQVFSAFGTVQKIAIFEKNGQTQALIQYPGINHLQLLLLALVHCVPLYTCVCVFMHVKY